MFNYKNIPRISLPYRELYFIAKIARILSFFQRSVYQLKLCRIKAVPLLVLGKFSSSDVTKANKI